MSPTGALNMSVFAAIWWFVGVRASGAPLAIVTIVPILVAVALIAAVLRRKAPRETSSDGEQQRRDRIIGIASAVEGVAILIAVNVLANTGHRDLTAPVIAIIVGLHFVPIARGFPAPRYYLTAAFLVALGLGAMAISGVSQRLLVTSAGAATVLWVTAMSVLLRTPSSGEHPVAQGA